VLWSKRSCVAAHANEANPRRRTIRSVVDLLHCDCGGTSRSRRSVGEAAPQIDEGRQRRAMAVLESRHQRPTLRRRREPEHFGHTNGVGLVRANGRPEEGKIIGTAETLHRHDSIRAVHRVTQRRGRTLSGDRTGRRRRADAGDGPHQRDDDHHRTQDAKDLHACS